MSSQEDVGTCFSRSPEARQPESHRDEVDESAGSIVEQNGTWANGDPARLDGLQLVWDTFGLNAQVS